MSFGKLVTVTIFGSMMFIYQSAKGESCEGEDQSKAPFLEQINQKPKDLLVSRADFGNKQIDRRGCCSWHNGVCGCQNGRAVCCDSTLSPSCGCN